MRLVSAYEVDFMTYWMACDIPRMAFFQEMPGMGTSAQFLNLPRLSCCPHRHENFSATGYFESSKTREDARKRMGTELLPEGMIDERGRSHGVMLGSDGLSLSILHLAMRGSHLSYTRVIIAIQSIWQNALVYRWVVCSEERNDFYNDLNESSHTRTAYHFRCYTWGPVAQMAYDCETRYNVSSNYEKNRGAKDSVGPYTEPFAIKMLQSRL
jgi:hypothetical protein